MTYRCLLVIFVAMALQGTITGCRQAAPAQDSSKLPVFTVSNPVEREVTDYVEYTGRTAAVQAEEIKARVTGFLVDMPFKEGTEIKKDAVLFKIDDRPYKAQFDQAEAQVGLYQAQLKLAKANYARDVELSAGLGLVKCAFTSIFVALPTSNFALVFASTFLWVFVLLVAYLIRCSVVRYCA
jgi:multidrug efflux pump subunit AcrA (membrane-fusion protein)